MFNINFNPSKWIPNFGSAATTVIKLPSVAIDDIETSTDRVARRLKHLILANHANHSILYHKLEFHNHTAHALGAAYLLGGTAEHLTDIYDEEIRELESWEDAPGEISADDWRDYLGKKEYQRAYVDFFEDQMVTHSYHWKELIQEYLFEGEKPLVNNLISGLAHSMIHTGYALELDSKTLAIEALAMSCCCYNFMHKYLDDPTYSQRTSTQPPSSLLNIMHKIREDKRFDESQSTPGEFDLEKLFASREDEILEYWNAWDLSDPTAQFQESQRVAAALVAGSSPREGDYNFFSAHVLTSSHAVRVLLPLVPAQHQLSLVRQWALLTIAVYILQGRPPISTEMICNLDVGTSKWKHVRHLALNGKGALDAHYVKVLRALVVAGQTWGDEDELFLKAAIRFGEGWDNWRYEK
ncbi:hypothetical protein BT63DRAFT_419709 [Microthyrium microscopicum]|uniref:Oxidoreductase AflY n=1 Tax=Microthyrium microscopicum TaxID=703497 RepID=A0A6A6USM2_9PEZI|nr:hypothetical protein BT63DRAFT_419709 [Microthyrium microscopicum]